MLYELVRYREEGGDCGWGNSKMVGKGLVFI